jgi:methionine-S-sulfoxide reductase
MRGVYKTRVGYAGGATKNPTYQAIGDHSEALEVTFDPRVISYKELLDVFWAAHAPHSRPYNRQYMSLILYNNNSQRKAAEAGKKEQEKILGETIYTEINELDIFYQAEDYHQKYNLQSNTITFDTLKKFYPDIQLLIESTTAARINGYLAGYGTSGQLQAEIDTLGLSDAGKEILLKQFSR